MWLTTDKKILIVGLGLIGGSYADGLTKKGYEVGAITRSQKSIDFALQKGLISSGKTEIDPDYIAGFDLIVFALYPKIFIQWIRENQKYIQPGAVLTDVTGVKKSVVYSVQEILRDDLSFIGAHPMAGKEVCRVENADATIFQKANYIVTPTDKNTEREITIAKELGSVLGFQTITELTPEKHDEMIGFLSQLTHTIAVSLMTCRDSEHFIDYTGDSFRDLTRIAKINDEMWSELFLLNQEELLRQMDCFIKQFSALRDDIASGDKEKIREVMKESTRKRILFDKKFSEEK